MRGKGGRLRGALATEETICILLALSERVEV